MKIEFFFKTTLYRLLKIDHLITGFLMLLFLLLYSPLNLLADGLNVGINAPSFFITSGSGKELSNKDVAGKVLIVFYETKDVKEKNRKAKNELNLFYSEQEKWVREIVMRLPVIDCSSAVWPITGIWNLKLRQNSEKEGMTVYGDWDGSMANDYNMKRKDANVMLVNTKGIMTYFKSGVLNDSDIVIIKELLKKMVNEI